MGIGTDLGGSVRIPAAFCGICSIKPTMQRTADMSRFVEDPRHITIRSVTGILGRKAEDLQLFLEVLNNAAKNMLEAQPLGNFKQVDISTLRIGYYLTDGLFEPMPAVKRAVLESIGELKRIGAKVIEFTPPDLGEAEELLFRILSLDGAFLFIDNLKGEKPMPQAAGLIKLAKATPLKRNILLGLTSLLGQQSVKRIVPFFGGKGSMEQEELKARQQHYTGKFIKVMNNSSIGELDALISPVNALPGYLHNTARQIRFRWCLYSSA